MGPSVCHTVEIPAKPLDEPVDRHQRPHRRAVWSRKQTPLCRRIYGVERLGKEQPAPLRHPVGIPAEFQRHLQRAPQQHTLAQLISLTSSYNATYNWDRGATIDDTTSVGNSISNQGRLSVNGRFNFESLYNKSKFLKSVNQKFNNRGNNSRTPQKRNRYQRTVTLRADTSTLVRHNLDSKKPVVSATLKAKPTPSNTRSSMPTRYASRPAPTNASSLPYSRGNGAKRTSGTRPGSITPALP